MRSVDGSAWTLAWVPGFELPAQPLATLRFEAGRATGTDSCNRYTTAYTRNGNQLQFGEKTAATLMACAPEVMQVANAVGAVLYDTRSYRIEFDTLTLVGADGKSLAQLKEQANQLAGTSWQVTGVNNGRQAVVGVLTGTSLTMVFGNDGKLSGSSGCNNYNASYQADGRRAAHRRPGGHAHDVCAARRPHGTGSAVPGRPDSRPARRAAKATGWNCAPPVVRWLSARAWPGPEHAGGPDARHPDAAAFFSRRRRVPGRAGARHRRRGRDAAVLRASLPRTGRSAASGSSRAAPPTAALR
jgi:heat shock protein HslJ